MLILQALDIDIAFFHTATSVEIFQPLYSAEGGFL